MLYMLRLSRTVRKFSRYCERIQEIYLRTAGSALGKTTESHDGQENYTCRYAFKLMATILFPEKY